MSKIIVIPLHIGDLIQDTYHMTAEEFGIYMRLIIQHYIAGYDGISDDVEYLAKIANSSEIKIIDFMCDHSDFFERKDEKIFQKRIQKEIKKMRKKSKTASENSRKRWDNKEKTDVDESMQAHSGGNGILKPLSLNLKPSKKEKTIKTKKDLQDTTLEDIQPWLSNKQKEGKIININVEHELERCKNHFLAKKRTIGTVYNWIINQQKWKDEKEEKENPEKKKAGADCSWEEGFGL